MWETRDLLDQVDHRDFQEERELQVFLELLELWVRQDQPVRLGHKEIRVNKDRLAQLDQMEIEEMQDLLDRLALQED